MLLHLGCFSRMFYKTSLGCYPRKLAGGTLQSTMEFAMFHIGVFFETPLGDAS